MNQFFTAEQHKRQQIHGINPHGVHCLNDAVSTKGIHCAEQHRGKRRYAARFLQIICHGHAAHANLGKNQQKQGFRHHGFRQQCYDQRKRRTQIIRKNAEELTTQ